MHTKAKNEFDLYLNECETYVWEWYIPEHKVRFGIPSLNSLWIDDKEKNIQFATMLERVHPDDIQKVLVRHTSPLYKSDKMFEVDLRLNVAAELMPDGQSSGKYEWYGFRGKTVSRDRLGRPTYVRGVAINLDQRYRAQQKLIGHKERQLHNARQQADYCVGVIQEVSSFIRNLAENANSLIASGGSANDEERLLNLTDLKEQVARLLELTDRVKFQMGENEPSSSTEFQRISLWEHMAELQQVYALQASSQMKFYFSNLYDSHQISVDVKLFDLLIDNLIKAQIRSHLNGYASLSYTIDEASETVCITISCVGTSDASTENMSSVSESGLGLSVCKLIAKRLWGDVSVIQTEPGRLNYIIELPVDARKASRKSFMQSGMTQTSGEVEEEDPENDFFDELSRKRQAEDEARQNLRAALPHVLIGLPGDAELYRNQHLFEVSVTRTTDELRALFDSQSPDIVFVDSNLSGSVSFTDLLLHMHQQSADTPVIVTDNYALRPLHKQVRQLGARYLLTNPLSLRKVNMMIKKYLK